MTYNHKISKLSKNNNNSQKEWLYQIGNIHTNTQFIYDDVYKNVKQKNKFQRNPKFTYFNTILKMKNKFQGKDTIYNSIFTEHPKVNSNCKKQVKSPLSRSSRQSSQIRIEKLNSHSFKIYKFNKSLNVNHLSETITGLSLNICRSRPRKSISQFQNYQTIKTQFNRIQAPKTSNNYHMRRKSAPETGIKIRRTYKANQKNIYSIQF